MASLTLWLAPQLSEPSTLKNPKRPSTGIGSFNFLASFNKKPYFGLEKLSLRWAALSARKDIVIVTQKVITWKNA